MGANGAVNVSVSACYLSTTESYASLDILLHNHTDFGLPHPNPPPQAREGLVGVPVMDSGMSRRMSAWKSKASRTNGR